MGDNIFVQGYGKFQDIDESSWIHELNVYYNFRKKFYYDTENRMIECKSVENKVLGQYDTDSLRGWVR